MAPLARHYLLLIALAATAWEESEKPYAKPGATLFGANLLDQVRVA